MAQEAPAAAITAPPPRERLGLQVNTDTGATLLRPTVPGNYSFNLTAIDAGGSNQTTTIQEWSVEVRERPIFERTATPFTHTPALGSARTLGQGWTYTFLPPPRSDVASTYFANATGNLTYSALGADLGDGAGEDGEGLDGADEPAPSPQPRPTARRERSPSSSPSIPIWDIPLANKRKWPAAVFSAWPAGSCSHAWLPAGPVVACPKFGGGLVADEAALRRVEVYRPAGAPGHVG